MPDVLSNEAYSFLSANDRYFWRWADDAQVIEWSTGATLAYRRELAEVATELAPEGLPPFGALLLVLAACRDGWPQARDEQAALRDLARQAQRQELLAQVLPMLQVISELPASLRNGSRARALLVGLVFEPIGLKLSATRSAEILHVLGNDALSAAVAGPAPARTVQQAFGVDLRALKAALGGLNPRLLEHRLRTGLDVPLKPAHLPLPEPPPGDFLAELADDPETAGLARLTRRLLGVLRLPRQAAGAGDLPLGGFADIANRGSPDRLLISELALDDLSLAARLVNNEALYLRREAPPGRPPEQRLILLDNGIRLWGMPRVFAMAAGLALVHTNRHDEVMVLSHRDGRFHPADLRTQAGLADQLAQLDPSPHPGRALRHLDRQIWETSEVVLITHQAVLADRAFNIALASLPHPPSYLIAVNRQGQVRLTSNRGRGQQILADATLDLEHLLTPGSEGSPPLRRQDIPGDLPIIFGVDPFPFRLPAHLHQGSKSAAIDDELGVVAVTSDRRLLHWDNPAIGGRQLLYTVPEARTYHTAINQQGQVAVLATQAHDLHLLKLGLEGEQQDHHHLGPLSADPLHLHLATDWLLIFYKSEVAVHDWQSGRCIDSQPYPHDAYLWWGNIVATDGQLIALSYNGQRLVHTPLSADDATELARRKDPKRITTYTQSPYSLMNRFRLIGINSGGGLTMEGNNGRLWDICIAAGHLRIVRSESRHVDSLRYRQSFEPIRGPKDAGFRLSKASWPNGSEAFLDSRGLLHLRSHDPQASELSLALCHHKPLAGWASDGASTGPVHFFPQASITPLAFHHRLKDFAEAQL